MYVIDLKNDAAFDAMVKTEREKDYWYLFPMLNKDNSTNCVDAVSSALRAGGVDVDDTNFFGIQTPSRLNKDLRSKSLDASSGIKKVEH